MRKIYPFLPLPFNKFAIFVLYGLLSIVLITLAQAPDTFNNGTKSDGCAEPKSVSQGNKVIIGYVRLFAQPSMNSNTIPWDLYDYINVIAYESEPYRPDSTTEPIRTLVSTVKSNNSDAKVLLSLRNYDVSKWPKTEGDYNRIISEVTDTIKDFGLDGIDIEYPGMRGRVCQIWDDDDDKEFLEFLTELSKKIKKDKKDKTFMLTVGRDIISEFKHDDIDFLNIEVYHNSLYINYRREAGMDVDDSDIPRNEASSNPNNPLDEYNQAYIKWTDAGFNKNKIIMGIDFGNTIQAVHSEPGEIMETQIIGYPPEVQFDPLTLETLGQYISPIKDFCTFGTNDTRRLELYSWPWKNFTTFFENPTQLISPNPTQSISPNPSNPNPSVEFCANTTNFFNPEQPFTVGWARGFNESDESQTPWLYRIYNQASPDIYLYVSYEDVDSLYHKLDFVVNQTIGGISISDVSYDDDENSLLKYMQVIRDEGSPTTTPKKGKETSDSDKNDPEKSDANNKTGEESTKRKKNPAGAIAGSVIGALALVLLIGAFGYKYRNRLSRLTKHSKPEAGDFISKGPIQTHTNLKNDLPPEPIGRNTAVIPVASGHVTAMFDFVGKEETDLSFKKGDIIEVLEKGDGPNDWWVGRVNGIVGEFPGNYVKET